MCAVKRARVDEVDPFDAYAWLMGARRYPRCTQRSMLRKLLLWIGGVWL